jgi:hypothetical protein
MEKTLAEVIGRAHAGGMSWTELGRVLGVTDDAEDEQALIEALTDSGRAVLKHLLRETT